MVKFFREKVDFIEFVFDEIYSYFFSRFSIEIVAFSLKKLIFIINTYNMIMISHYPLMYSLAYFSTALITGIVTIFASDITI